MLVDGPNLVPLHIYRVLRGSLVKHEILECFRGHTTAHDALNSGETRIVPSIDVIVLDEPAELALRKTCAEQVQLGEIVDNDRTKI